MEFAGNRAGENGASSRTVIGVVTASAINKNRTGILEAVGIGRANQIFNIAEAMACNVAYRCYNQATTQCRQVDSVNAAAAIYGVCAVAADKDDGVIATAAIDRVIAGSPL